jgi:hypothetical protein
LKRCSVSPFRDPQTADLGIVPKVSEKVKDSFLQSIGEVLDKLYHLSGAYTLELIVGDALIVSDSILAASVSQLLNPLIPLTSAPGTSLSRDDLFAQGAQEVCALKPSGPQHTSTLNS